MPQEQHVVRCYACKKFQVQIVKKVPKWQCKVCSEKQSLMKVYAQGSGKDCRLHVQNLNMQQGLLMSQETPNYESPDSHYEDEPFFDTDSQVVLNKVSKWSDYLDDNGPTQAGAKSWKEDDTSDDLPGNMLRGRKRRLSNPDNYEDYSYSTYDQSCQPDAEALDLSSGVCASDILRNLHVNQEVTKHPMLPHPSTSGFNNSKWSQFVSPRDNDPPLSGSNGNQRTLKNVFKDKCTVSAATNKASIPFATSGSQIVSKSIAKQSVMDRPSACTSSGNGFSWNGGGKSATSTIVKNPFNATDDENLDTLLDF
ncbi:MRN complex-interacting protein [Thrips palmi]|uniref:MRN complex-interacting protein n=1 Tax=Thrips palmi TaxID=161013 RepID=A0A6P8ZNS3_THRPL|nr:MRN complex-interacting protein [Thrips palmi]